MTLRISTGLRNAVASGGSYAQVLGNGRIEIYTGAQPATADTAVSGTLLCTITVGSAAHTAEVRATGTLTLAGSAGSINTVTVDGFDLIDAAVSYNTSLTQTAVDLADAINNSQKQPNYTATSSGAVVTIVAPLGAGASANTLVVAYTATTMTATAANMSGGVTPVNGLRFGTASAGVIAKLSTQSWTGVNAATGTAGWYRFYGSVADAGGADSAGTAIREDGSVATSGAQLNMTSTSLTSAATTTIDTWSRTFPAS
jgi:hypothetical protein